MKLKYLLDTNIISEGTKKIPNDKVVNRFYASANIGCISSVSWYELQSGVKRLPESKQKFFLQLYLEKIAANYEIIPFDKKCAEIQSSVETILRKNGLILPYQDSQIAAAALANDLILVTRNVKDFESIRQYCSLQIENWFE